MTDVKCNWEVCVYNKDKQCTKDNIELRVEEVSLPYGKISVLVCNQKEDLNIK